MGTRLRTDDNDSSSIVDMAEGRYTMVNHEDKSYYTITMAQMQSQMEQAQEQMAEQNPMAQQGPPPNASFEVKMSTDRTGRTRDFGGYSAEQVLITMEMVPTSPEAEQSAAMMGNMVLFTEIWMSTDFPGADEYRAAQERMGEAFMEGGGADMAGGMAGAMMGNPGMREALEKNAEVMKDLEGVPVRTVTHMVTVPAGMEFDPDAVLAAEDQPLESGDMPSAEDMARGAARGAMSRRLGGLLGRRNQEPQEEPDAPAGPAAQTITMRSSSTIQEIKTTSLSEDLFQPPPDYTERQPEWMRGG
jgi:hypothetical protein